MAGGTKTLESKKQAKKYENAMLFTVSSRALRVSTRRLLVMANKL
jgi:hypothetical protein